MAGHDDAEDLTGRPFVGLAGRLLRVPDPASRAELRATPLHDLRRAVETIL